MPSGQNIIDMPFDLEWGGKEDDELLSIGGSTDKDLIAAIEPQVEPGDGILIVDVEVTWSYDDGIRAGGPDDREAPSSEDTRIIERAYKEGFHPVDISKLNEKATKALKDLVDGYDIDYDWLEKDINPDDHE